MQQRPEVLTRAAQVAPQSFNAETRTVDVVFSTGAEVERRDMSGPFFERLDMSTGAMDSSRLVGAPVLKDHRSELDSTLGAVESASTDGKQGLARIRLSERPEVSGFVRDIQSGILRQVSVGYLVREQREENADGKRVKVASKWTPLEISFTPIGSDPGARTRSDHGDKKTMTTATANEAEAQIRAIGKEAGLPADSIDDMITRKLTTDEARGEAFEYLKRQIPAQPIRSAIPASVSPNGHDDPDFRARAMADALYLRADPTHEVDESARPFVGSSIPFLARQSLEANQISTMGMSEATIVTRALHTTSDIPNILADFARRTLRGAYEAAPSGVKAIARRTTNQDFRTKHVLRIGEFRRGSIGESKEAYKIDTYGRVFGITRQAIVNDDLGAFTDTSRTIGVAADQFEAQFLVDLLQSNPNLEDGNPVFDAAHGNVTSLVTAALLSGFEEARRALRTMKGLDGTTAINAVPTALLAPAALETEVEQIVEANIAPTTVTDANPFRAKFSLVVDPRLDVNGADELYMFADAATLPVLEYAHLAGEEGVQVETRAGFDVDGVEIRARLDFGGGFVDYRGGFRTTVTP